MVRKTERTLNIFAELCVEKWIKTFMNGRGLKRDQHWDRRPLKGTHICTFRDIKEV